VSFLVPVWVGGGYTSESKWVWWFMSESVNVLCM